MRQVLHAFFLSWCILLGVVPTAGATPTLYGLSTAGKLITINEATGQVTSIRGALPAGTYYSLAMIDGKFYTYSSTGQFYRFGFTTGDEVNLGSVSKVVRSMSVRPLDGRVFAVVSTDGDIYGDRYAQVDLLTGNLTDYFMPSLPNYPTITERLYALAFFANSEMLMTSTTNNPSSWSYVYRVLVPTGAMYDLYSGQPYYAGLEKFGAIAINPTNQNIYMTSTPDRVRFFSFVDSYPPDASGSDYTHISDLIDGNMVPYPMGGLAYNFDTSTVKKLRVLPGKNAGGTLKMSVGVF